VHCKHNGSTSSDREGRYKAIVVEPEAWGLELSRYLHLNPVRVGACGLDKEARRRQRLGVDEKPEPDEVRERIVRLRSFRWSSYRAYVGFATGPGWLQVNTLLKGLETVRWPSGARRIESMWRLRCGRD